MSVIGVNNYSSALSIADLYATQSTDEVSSDTSLSVSTSSSSVSLADSLDLSKPAEIYSKLQELAKSDPEKLKEVCAKIADKLSSAAEESSGGDNKMLSDLAEKFQNVAEGGDVSQLKPPEPPSGGGRPQPPVEQYAKQQDAQLADFLNSQGSQNTSESDKDQLLSSILDEINDALAS
ncbi:MAG: hypothetical protein ABFD54_09835 [Armatimonadota bacterium]|nr:hypothetical protein [bacterium]